MVYDVIIVGGGMAGASVAASLAADAEVLLLERESHFGYHSTGRSAALFSEIYGNKTIRALTRASKSFLLSPPTGFADTALVRPRGQMFIANEGQVEFLDRFCKEPGIGEETIPIAVEEAKARCAILRDAYVAAAALEPGAVDIEVDALLQAYLRVFRSAGGQVRREQPVLELRRRSDNWVCVTPDGEHEGSIVVNAAGAWADEIAYMADTSLIGLTPCRRTAAIVDAPMELNRDCPFVQDIEEKFYFKPDAGALLISPCDETPVEPSDVQPEDLEIAIAVDRIQHAANVEVKRLRGKWAGLRSFVKDRTPVVGFDADAPGFFWLAGQGGYGIQTAPALGCIAADLIRERLFGKEIGSDDLVQSLSPDRASLGKVRKDLTKSSAAWAR